MEVTDITKLQLEQFIEWGCVHIRGFYELDGSDSDVYLSIINNFAEKHKDRIVFTKVFGSPTLARFKYTNIFIFLPDGRWDIQYNYEKNENYKWQI